MRARAVIGAAFGDEGKGAMVDYFCRQSSESPLVVRFNGGAQAGHTVVTPEGERHVFHHYGAGTLAGADTFLSRFFLVNPVAWFEEFCQLSKLAPMTTILYVYPGAPVTTVYDMMINQKLEASRSKRHGSCGLGVHETMLRHNVVPLRMIDLYRQEQDLEELMLSVHNYAMNRLIDLGLDTDENKDFINNETTMQRFMADCTNFREHVELTDNDILQTREVIFEGAQGLLLDEDNKRFFPHVTHSHTGLKNVIELCKPNGIDELDVTYVTRSYLTRHGAGELPGEDRNLSYEDNTNVHNDWQQSLRFAPFDWHLVVGAINQDLKDNKTDFIECIPSMAMTHMDQYEFSRKIFHSSGADYESYGPTAKDVRTIV